MHDDRAPDRTGALSQGQPSSQAVKLEDKELSEILVWRRVCPQPAVAAYITYMPSYLVAFDFV